MTTERHSYGSEPIERTILSKHGKRAKGSMVYLPGAILEKMWGGPLPKELWASRIVLDPGTHQILIRFHSEP